MSTRYRRVARGALSTATMTLGSNLTGLIRQLAFAWVYGAGRSMDAFLVASVLSQMVFGSIDSAISATLIPVYTELRQHSEEEADRFMRAVSGLVAAFTVLAGLLFYLGAPVLVHLLAPGFGKQEASLASFLLRVMVPSLLFMGLASISVGFLQTKGVFGQPAAMYIPRNIALIALATWLGHRYGISVLAWGSLLGAILQLYVVLRPMRRLGTSLRLGWQPRHAGIGMMLRRLPGVFVNFFMYQAALVVDRILASGLPAGMISALNYSQLLISFPLNIFTSVAIALFPTLSELAVSERGPTLARAVRLPLRLTAFLVAPITFYSIFLRAPLVAIIYQHGAFGQEALRDTAFAMLFFAIGMISMAMNGILGRAIFALGETRVLFRTAFWSVGATIVTDLILIRPLAQGGLALGTTLGSWVGTLVLLQFLSRHLEGFRVSPIVSDIVWSAALSLAAYGTTYLAYLHWHGSTLPHGSTQLAIVLISSFLVGTMLYLGLHRLVGPMRGNLRRAIREGRRAFET